jgi:hypothetical protein
MHLDEMDKDSRELLFDAFFHTIPSARFERVRVGTFKDEASMMRSVPRREEKPAILPAKEVAVALPQSAGLCQGFAWPARGV